LTRRACRFTGTPAASITRFSTFKANEKRGTFPLGGRRCDHH
jgi:hypothetical protein